MSLAAVSYFEHLKTYVNHDYIASECAEGKVELTEKYFRPEETRPRTRRIELLIPNSGMVFRLDNDDVDVSRRRNKPPLFHFLNDQGRPWSKRCDFVVLYANRRAFHADCIEFKSKSLATDKIVPQLNAGAAWVKSLKRTIEHYTGYSRRIRLRKFVFAENDNPEAYLDSNRQLSADPSIRYYHFDEVNGQPLADLQNTSNQEI